MFVRPLMTLRQIVPRFCSVPQQETIGKGDPFRAAPENVPCLARMSLMMSEMYSNLVSSICRGARKGGGKGEM